MKKTLENKKWKEMYLFLRGVVSGGGIYYSECSTACIHPAHKQHLNCKHYITLCRQEHYYKNYRNLCIDLGHELGHLYKITNKLPLMLTPQEPFVKYYSETEATDFMIQVIKFFKIKLTKYEKKVLRELIYICKKFDEKKGNLVINIDI